MFKKFTVVCLGVAGVAWGTNAFLYHRQWPQDCYGTEGYSNRFEEFKNGKKNRHYQYFQAQMDAFESLQKLGMIEQHKILKAKGFQWPNENLNALVQSDGDLSKAEAQLTSKQHAEEEALKKHRHFGGHRYDENHHRGHWWNRHCRNEQSDSGPWRYRQESQSVDGKVTQSPQLGSKQQLLFTPERLSNLDDKLRQLNQYGIDKSEALRLLAMYDGNVDQIKQTLH